MCTVIDLNKDVRFCFLRACVCTDHHTITILVDSYTDSLSFKFYEDLFIGSREIAETKSSMHISHF